MGDIGGLGQIESVLTDILIGAYSHAANIPQHATLLMPNLSGCSAEIPPRPPLRKGGIIPVLADDLFDTAQQTLPVFLPSLSWGEGPGERAKGLVQHLVSG